MDENSLISVIVPVYNAEKYLDRCIESIVNQSYKNLEIILINDGSADNSGYICDKWSEKDNRIEVIHQVNSGVSATRNNGLDNAKGEYITFVDADDYIEFNYCEVLFNVLKKNNVDVSYCNKFNNKSQDTQQEFVWKTKEYNPFSKACYFVVWGALYKSDILKNIRFDNDLYVAEDTYFFAKVVKNSNSIVYIDKALYHYIIYDNSAFHGSFDNKKFTEIESWRRICLLFKDNKEIEKRCKATFAIRCEIMLRKYINDKNFKEHHEVECKKEYCKNWKYLIQQMFKNKKYKDLIKEILHFLFFPLWIVYIKNKNNSKR